MSELCKASVIIVAAGKGSRMRQNMNKQYIMLSNKPVLVHTLEAFDKVEQISEIIVVIHEADRLLFEKAILGCYSFSKITAVVNGGKDRQESVYNGLMAVSKQSRIVSVHDGARPLISKDIIIRSVETAMEKGAACVGVPVKDTIKRATENHIVRETLDRTALWAVQTPQVFQRDILVKAHQKATDAGFRGTDDAMLIERLGYPVHMVMGSYSNIKITTPDDLVLAEALQK